VSGRKILKNWSLLTISNIIQQGLSFLVLIPIARLLELSKYGTFTLILTTIGMAQVFGSLGLRLVVIREIARNGRNLYQIARKTLSLSLLGFALTGIPLALYLLLVEKIASPALLAISILLLLSQILWNFAEPLTFGKEQMQFSSIIGSVFAVLWFALVFALPGWIRDLTSLLTLYLLIQLVKSLVYLFLIWRQRYFRAPEDGESEERIGYGRILSQSLPLYISGILNASITQLPILFLSRHSGAVEVAYFGLGSKLSLPFVLVYSNMMNAIYPLLARLYRENDAADFARHLKNLFLAVWLAGIAISFVLSLFSADIIRLLFGAKFAAAAPSFSVLLWVTLNHMIHACMGLVFLAADKERLMVKLSVFNGLLTGVAAYWGSYYGAAGLAIATFIGLSVSYLVHWHFVQKLARIPINTLLLYGFYAAYLGLGIGCLYFRYLNLPLKLALVCAGSAPFLIAYAKNKERILGLFQGGAAR